MSGEALKTFLDDECSDALATLFWIGLRIDNQGMGCRSIRDPSGQIFMRNRPCQEFITKHLPELIAIEFVPSVYLVCPKPHADYI
jgi:hypothetical protein